jgi:hypothetical protein
MNPDYDIYEQIDLYLSNKLSPEVLRQFNEKLAQNQSLRELVEAQKTANDFILDQEMIRLKERMRKDLNNEGGSGNSTKIKIILSSLLLISASVYTYTLFQSDQNSKKKNTIINTPEVKPSNDLSLNKPALVSQNEKPITQTKEISSTKVQPTENISSKSEEKESVKNNIPEKTIETPLNIPINNNNNNKVVTNNENKKQDCSTTKIEAETRVEYGNNIEDVTIYIDKSSVQGGTPPYLFSLDKENYSSSVIFKHVEEGIHTLHMKDKNNCLSQKFVAVQWIMKAKEIDDVFSPSRGDKWAFPLNNNSDATITIQSKSGSIVYSTKINGGYPGEWDGRDNNGTELETGNYYFIINFTNNEMVKGHITIIR